MLYRDTVCQWRKDKVTCDKPVMELGGLLLCAKHFAELQKYNTSTALRKSQ